MLASFKKIVKEESSSLSIPKEILDAMNSQIPVLANAEYVDMGDGVCILTPKPPYNMQLQFPAIEILSKLPDDIKTQQELFDYLYRTQTAIHFKINGMGKAIFNRIEINLTELTKFPLENVTMIESTDFYLEPHPFPPISPITVTAAGVKVTLDAKRVPEPQKDLFVMSVGEDSWLKMRFVIDTSTLKTNMTIKLEYSKCKTVSEFVTAMKIWNGFICGDYSISCLNVSSPLPIGKPINEKYIMLWEKVKKLEKILNVSFVPSSSLTMAEAFELNQLFRSFLENKPYATAIKPEPDVGIYIADAMDLGKLIGDSIVFFYNQTVNWDLLGTKFKMIDLCCVFGADVASITKDDSNSETPFFIQLTPTKNEEMTLVKQTFSDIKAVKAFQASFKDHTEFLDFFSQAEKIHVEF